MDDKIVTTQQKNAVSLALIALCVIALLLGIEYLILTGSNRAQAYQTATMLSDQVRTVLVNNERKETALVDSLKEDYITKAKAVSYIIDSNPETESDIAELIRIANLMSIDEIHIFDESGTIYGGTIPPYYGFNFDSGEQMAFFKPMLENKALSMCQDITPNTAEGKSMMYAICWNDAGTRMTQIGIEPVRLIEELRTNEVSEVIDSMPAYDGIEILVADRETGEIIGSTVSKQIGTRITDIGLDVEGRDLSDICHFEATVARRASYCSASVLDSNLIAIIQERSVVDEGVPLTLLSVLLYLLIAAFVIGLVFQRMTRRVVEEQHNANTDSLTGLLNRRAYENDLKEYSEGALRSDLIYVSADLNGLKTVNDTFGHEAGDELIRGAAQCMKQCFAKAGKLYRIGGDEFAAILFADESQLDRLRQDFSRAVETWSEHHKHPLVIACGCAKASEFPDLTALELAKTADKRMYEDKSRYYRESGHDRRG